MLLTIIIRVKRRINSDVWGMSTMKNEAENQTIGENIKLYRIKAGLTQKDLSHRIYVQQDAIIKPATIKAYEMGKCSVSAINLHRIAAALGVDSNEFHEDACPGILFDNIHSGWWKRIKPSESRVIGMLSFI